MHRTDLCFSICRFSQVVFIPQAQPHAQSLFLFPIVFGINTNKKRRKFLATKQEKGHTLIFSALRIQNSSWNVELSRERTLTLAFSIFVMALSWKTGKSGWKTLLHCVCNIYGFRMHACMLVSIHTEPFRVSGPLLDGSGSWRFLSFDQKCHLQSCLDVHFWNEKSRLVLSHKGFFHILPSHSRIWSQPGKAVPGSHLPTGHIGQLNRAQSKASAGPMYSKFRTPSPSEHFHVVPKHQLRRLPPPPPPKKFF